MPDPHARLRAVQEALEVAQDAAAEAQEARARVIHSVHAEGLTAAQIADVLGVHVQIVYRILRRP